MRIVVVGGIEGIPHLRLSLNPLKRRDMLFRAVVRTPWLCARPLTKQPLSRPGHFATRREPISVPTSRRFVSPREIASLCGPPFTEVDIFDVGDEMGLKGAYNRYGRLEARLIIAKLMVRTSSPDVVERLLGAYTGLAAKSENNEVLA
jgi:hypothetical protein